nr:LysR family transcriptional regulator [Cytophagales bacterium]
MEIRLRCWITLEGEKFFGPGRMQLLLRIQEEGSVSKAAKAMGMSYKKAWDMIYDLNLRGRQPYVILKKGGEKGGGAMLTPHALQVIAQFQTLTTELQKVAEAESTLLDLL